MFQMKLACSIWNGNHVIESLLRLILELEKLILYFITSNDFTRCFDIKDKMNILKAVAKVLAGNGI